MSTLKIKENKQGIDSGEICCFLYDFFLQTYFLKSIGLLLKAIIWCNFLKTYLKWKYCQWALLFICFGYGCQGRYIRNHQLIKNSIQKLNQYFTASKSLVQIFWLLKRMEPGKKNTTKQQKPRPTTQKRENSSQHSLTALIPVEVDCTVFLIHS